MPRRSVMRGFEVSLKDFALSRPETPALMHVSFLRVIS